MRGELSAVVRDRGFGIIKSGPQCHFFHRSALAGVDFDDERAVYAGLRVEFELEIGPKGTRAVAVRPSPPTPLA